MIKITQILLLIVLAIINISCSDSADVSLMTAAQKALHNNDRPSDDRKTDKSRRAEKILTYLDIKEGMTVVDIDSGAGYYTELFSHMVGNEGKVYMQNGPRYVSKYPDLIEGRLEDNRLSNVTRLDSSWRELNLPENVDLVFVSLAYHDLYVPQKKEEWNADVASYIKQIHSALKANGKLVIIDHSALKGSGLDAAQKLHRIDENIVISDMQTRGFKMASSSDDLRRPNDDRKTRIFSKEIKGRTDQFVLMFEKIQ